MAKIIYVLHENDAWVEPLRRAFVEQGLPFEEWFLSEGQVDLEAEPPEGVFYNRMSASSYTRDHRFGPELTAVVLAWLERHGRRVFNNGRALQLEISKMAQYAALEAHGIATPRTIAAVGRPAILEAAAAFAPGPVILKPNRGGKGHGVQLFRSVESLRAHVASDAFAPPVDGVALLQDYIESAEPFITRVEFIGGAYYYAVRVDASRGFELCPADACQVGDAFCPVGDAPAPAAPKFAITDDVDPALVRRYRTFLDANGIAIGAVEFVTDKEGRVFTYDVNTNTNYNSEAEARDGRSGMAEIARFLGRALERVTAEKRAPFRLAG
jgi:hypothetical protein